MQIAAITPSSPNKFTWYLEEDVGMAYTRLNLELLAYS